MAQEPEQDPFPLWHELATKGDVISAVVHAKGLSLALWRMLLAHRRGDQEDFEKAFQQYDDAWQFADETIKRLGRGDDGESA